MPHDTIALILFVTAYGLFVAWPGRRSSVAVVTGLLLVATGTVSPHEALDGINWNVMGIFVGTLIAAEVFIESRFPAYFAEVIVDRAPNTAWALLFICAMTGILSAFVENVATVLIVAPIALSLAKKIEVNPTYVMIGIAISSNLQGTATLIGDPPSMLLGGYAKMTFLDFFVYRGRPSIFFAVELGALTSFAVLYYVFRRHHKKIDILPTETVKSWVPTILLVLLILMLAGSSFFDKNFCYLAGVICMVFGVAMLVWNTRGHVDSIRASLRKLDWNTTFFLMGIFVIVESLTVTGWIDRISAALSGFTGGNTLFAYVALIVLSIIVSAFVDNVPYLAAMLPVAGSMAQKLQIEPSILLFGLLIGASLGGNVTPIGASANIVATGLLRKEGYTVSFGQFAKISVPFTLAAVIPAALFVWIIWAA
ncbi:MAG TPA: SLC13 family permease [Candidatus Hydrogenedentes bacterium]|nr:SLC13 family permease [Candidatus Hydrogenedentota bacterium]HPG68122.1 SLC13 family permease [Candidatus Hydrogenedentota bacterium]